MPLVKFNPNSFVLGQISVPDPDLEIRVGAGGGGRLGLGLGLGLGLRLLPLDNGGEARSPKIFFGLKIRGGGPLGPLPCIRH